MSRYDIAERDDDRGEQRTPAAHSSQGRGGGPDPLDERPDHRDDDRPRHARTSTTDIPTDGLRLPRTEERQPVTLRDCIYHLRASETDLLATIGIFRVVPAADLPGARTPADARTGDLGHLADQGLIERRQVVINEHPAAVVVLTRDGKESPGVL